MLVIARVAALRSDGNTFEPKQVSELFWSLSLPQPRKISDRLLALEKQQLLTRRPGKRGVWTVTPSGQALSERAVSNVDLAGLAQTTELAAAPLLGGARHPTLPPELAPPDLLPNLRKFLDTYPFDKNVFIMTRFPQGRRSIAEKEDPVIRAILTARQVVEDLGFAAHLADDRLLSDQLWHNVAGHMWGSRFGIAIFEDRVDRGLNYNLTIEVGAMMMTGRRCAILKDRTIESLPSDLVGHIYQPVDLDDATTVADALHRWFSPVDEGSAARNAASSHLRESAQT